MEDSYDMQEFEAVWQRVVSGENKAADKSEYKDSDNLPAGKGCEDLLKKFIKNETESICFFRTLACKCNNSQIRAVFMAIIRDDECHLKKLEALYFVLKGDSFCPKVKKAEIGSVMCALRDAYKQKNKMTAMYLEAACNCDDENTSCTYRLIAADERKHARMILDLIEKMMC